MNKIARIVQYGCSQCTNMGFSHCVSTIEQARLTEETTLKQIEDVTIEIALNTYWRGVAKQIKKNKLHSINTLI